MTNPVGQCQTRSIAQNTKRLTQGLFSVRQVTKGLLADNGIHAFVGKRNFQHAALDHACIILQTHSARQLLGSGNPRRGQFDTGDVGPVSMGQISDGAPEAGTEIGNARSVLDPRGPSKLISCRQAPVMILIVWKQIFRTHPVEMATSVL